MQKNVLYDLQLSMVDDYVDGKFLFTVDSNVNVATFTLNGLAKLHPDWNFYVLVPFMSKIVPQEGKSSIRDYFPDELEKNIYSLEYEYYGYPFLDRMHFDIKSLDRTLEINGDIGINMDLLLLNDPTKVLAYKTYFYNRQKKFIPIISRNHWVSGRADRKVPEEIDFFMRQLEGCLYGTYSTFNSQFAKSLFLDNAKEFLNAKKIKEMSSKCFGFETVDLAKMLKHKEVRTSELVKEKYDKFTILWAHRLSYYTNYEKVFDLLNELYQKRQDFQTIVPDPGNKFTQEELHKRWPHIKILDKTNWTHEKYLDECWKSSAVIGWHSYPATWGGLSAVEPMCCGAIPILYNDYAYKEMFYRKPTSIVNKIFFKTGEGMLKNIEYLIDNALDREILSELTVKFVTEELSMNKYILMLDRIIINALNIHET
jgi:glycosyltransferase involved in cell wall biosynthesis